MFDDFLHSLSVAAFLRKAGGSMLENTGSHRRGVERRVPDLTLQSTWFRTGDSGGRWLSMGIALLELQASSDDIDKTYTITRSMYGTGMSPF